MNNSSTICKLFVKASLVGLLALYLAAPVTATEVDVSQNFTAGDPGYSANVPATAANLLALPGNVFVTNQNPSTNGQSSQQVSALIDGVYGTIPAAGTGNTFEVGILSNTVYTYTLPDPKGYDLTSVDIFTSWGDASRIQPKVDISYATIFAPNTFNLIQSVNYSAAAGTGAWVHITGISANAVKTIKFSFGAQQNGFVGYTELAVGGAVSTSTNTWTGATDTNWSTATNWTLGVPATGQSIVLTGGKPHDPLNENLTLTLPSLVFDSSTTTSLNITSSNSSTLTLSNIIVDPAAAAHTANFNVILPAGTDPTSAGANNQFTLGGVVSGTGMLSSTGKLKLSGANTYTGGTTVNNGTLTAAGGSAAATTANLVVSNTAGNATLNVTGTMTGYQMPVGLASGANGAVNIVPGGVLNIVSAEDGGPNDQIHAYGAGNGGYGALYMTGGTLIQPRFQFGGASGNTGVGVGLITGGTVNTNGYLIISRNGTSTGVLTVAGGTLNHAAANQDLSVLLTGSGRAELNVAGGTVNNTAKLVYLNGASGFSGTGTAVLNLDSGTLLTNSVTQTAGRGFVNFNGGTLKPTTAGIVLQNNFTATTVNGPFAGFNGGAVIDSNNLATSIPGNLVAPTGNGVTGLTITSGGSGYIGAPYVQILDGGVASTATAYATVGTDATNPTTFGKITSVVVTNPGVITGLATVALNGGGGTGGAMTVTTGPNTSGGLTKIGLGSLTLSGVNTYTGGTFVNVGSLNLAGGGTGVGTIRGPLTISTGATAAVTTKDVFGFNAAATGVSTININGGTLDTSFTGNSSETLTGVTVNMTGGNWTNSFSGSFFQLFQNGFGNTTINTLPSSITATISTKLDLKQTSPTVFTVPAGTVPAGGPDLLVSGAISETTVGSSITKAGNGLMKITGVNSYTGAINVTGGTFSIATPASISSQSPINVSTGATLTTNVNNTFGGSPGGIWTIAGSILGTANTQTMPFNVTLNNGIMGGTVNPTLGTFTVNSTTITANGSSNAISSGNIGLPTGNLTLTPTLATDALLVSVPIGATSALGGGLVTNGSGKVTLTAANTYTGGTQVASGALLVNNSTGSGTGTGPVVVTGGTAAHGTLGGSGFITGAVTLSTNGATTFAQGPNVTPGDTNSAKTLTISTVGLTTNNFSNLTFDLNSATTAGGGVNDLISTNVVPVILGPTQVNINTVGPLTPNASYTLISGYTGTITNFANLSLNTVITGVDIGHSGMLVNSPGALLFVVNPDAEMSLTINGPSAIVPGSFRTVTVTLKNNGPTDEAAGSTLNIPAPPGATFSNVVTISNPAGVSVTDNSTTTSVSLTFGIIPAGTTITVTYNENIPVTATPGTTVSDTVTVTETTLDSNPANNAPVTSTATVTNNADLGVTVTVSPSNNLSSAGSTITYTAVVSNAGDGAASLPRFTFPFPNNVTLVSISVPAGWTQTSINNPGDTSGTLVAMAPSMPPAPQAGSSVNFVIVYTINAGVPGGTVLTNTATIFSTAAIPTPDPQPSNNTATTNYTVAPLNVLVSDFSVLEGDIGLNTISATFTLSAASTQTVSVDFMTVDGTAKSPQDYLGIASTVTFAPGQVSQQSIIQIVSNTLVEPDKTFSIHLFNPVNVAIIQNDNVCTITNDDFAGALQFTAANYPVAETAGSVTVTVTRESTAKASNTTVAYATSDGTAVAGVDYTATSGVLTFDYGVMTQTFTIPIINKSGALDGTTINLTLSNPNSGAVIVPGASATLGAQSTATVTIFARPTITSPLNVSTPISAPFSYQITATGQAPITFSLGTNAVLPPGLVFSASLGLISGTPTVAGTYSVPIVATNAIGSDSQVLVITVTGLPNTGTSLTTLDSDGDGFPDELEVAIGADPLDGDIKANANDAGSTPLGIQNVQYGVFKNLKLAIQLNFAKTNSDSIKMSGSVDCPSTFKLSGALVYFDIGGVIKRFALDSSGKSHVGGDLMIMKSARNVTGLTRATTFTLSIKNANFQSTKPAVLDDEGLTNATSLKAPKTVPVLMLMNSTLYKALQNQVYTAKAGHSGKSKNR